MFVRVFSPGKTYLSIAGVGLCLTLLFGFTGCACLQQEDDFTRRTERYVEVALNHFASRLSAYPLPSESVTSLLKQYLRDNDYISGVTFAYAPVRENGQVVKHAPKISCQNGQYLESDAVDAGIDYTASKWYSVPAKTGKPYWTGWYSVKKGSRVFYKTYAVPVYAQNDPQKLIGVVTSDIASD